MNWLKENWFKIGIVAFFAVMSFVLIYYFFFYIPERDMLADLRVKQVGYLQLSSQQRIREDKERAEKNERIPTLLDTYSEPKFTYSEKMDACLYERVYTSFSFSTGKSIISFELRNLNSNEIIMSYTGLPNDSLDLKMQQSNIKKVAELLRSGKTIEEARKELADE